jgi:hypothetical protein
VLVATAISAAVLFSAVAQERVSIDSFARPVRVQVAMNFFVPWSMDDVDDEAHRARQRARQMVYDLAAKECAVLLSSLAGSCRLEALSVNVNRQPSQQPSGFYVNGSMTYSITLK